jgi:PAS domain S-box-containing protein
MLGNIELVSVMLDPHGRITYCNDYLLRLTGWEREEVMGRDAFDLFIPPELAGMREIFAQLVGDRPEARHHENEIVTRSGERRLIRWNNSLLRSGAGAIIGTASIGEDITERRLADEVLKKRAAELERFHRLSVGRELQMIELKKEVNALAKQAGGQPLYDLAFLEKC